MSLFKRKIGRRAAGVGVGVALLMLGLEAPAWAAPTISAISPTSGPNNCVAVVTGTGFTEFPEAQTTVDFMTGTTPVAQTNFSVIDDKTIWVGVSGLAGGTSYTVRVSNPGTPTGVTSTATFLATSTGVAGGCAPTITSFAPTCGPAGTTVVITGTNLIDSTNLEGADTYFAPYDTAVLPARLAAHTVPDVDDVTSISVVVPSTTTTATNSGTTDGPIKVITDVGSAFSAASYLVPPPDCVPVGPTTHARSITLSLRKHLVARGKVSSTEDPAFTDCVASVPVKIQRRVSGHWKTVGSTTTSDTGAYKKRIKDKPGKYRAKAPKVSLGTPVTDTCSGATSPVRRVS